MTVKDLRKYLIAGLLLALPALSNSAGMYLSSESAASLAFAHADGAALAEDATTNYYNPAGFVRLKCPTLSFSAVGLFLRQEFTGTTTARYTFLSSTQITGKTNASARGAIPAFYYVMPLFEDYIWIGVGVSSPFALQIKYPYDSLIRYATTNEKLTSVNLNLNMGFKLCDQLALGYGVDVMRVDMLSVNNILNPFNPAANSDWNFQFSTNGYAAGANFGILYQPCETTRIGLSYRSKIRIYTNGDASTNTNRTFQSTAAAPLNVDNFKINFTFPAVTYLSIYQQITPCFEVMGSLELEQWSQFKMLQLENIPVPTIAPIDLNYMLNFRDVVTAAVGARYQITDHWAIKSGIAFIPSAVGQENRNIVIPVADSWLAAVGAHYQFNRCLGFDLTYAHPFFRGARLSHSLAIPITGSFFPITYTTTETGIARGSGNFIGGQLNYTFD